MAVGLHFGRDDSITCKAALHIAEYLAPLATGIKASENPSAILTPETKQTKKYLFTRLQVTTLPPQAILPNLGTAVHVLVCTQSVNQHLPIEKHLAAI